MMTYRYRGHSMSDPAKYRTRDEVNRMRTEHDPIEQVRQRLLEDGADEAQLKQIEGEVGTGSPKRRNSPRTAPSPIRPSCGRMCWPKPDCLGQSHGYRSPDAGAVADDDRGQDRPLAEERGRAGQGRRCARRDRDRQGDDGGRSGRRGRARQDRDPRGHRARRGQHADRGDRREWRGSRRRRKDRAGRQGAAGNTGEGAAPAFAAAGHLSRRAARRARRRPNTPARPRR